MSAKRTFFLILYYGIAYHLPSKKQIGGVLAGSLDIGVASTYLRK